MPDSRTLVAEFAHELRNAISPLRSVTDTLRLRGGDSATVQQVLAILDRGLESMLRTIDVSFVQGAGAKAVYVLLEST